MAERIAEMGVPNELLNEFYDETKMGEPLTQELKNGMFDIVFDLFYNEGVIGDGDKLKLTFFVDDNVPLDSYERTVWLYDAESDEKGNMLPGELISEATLTVMPDSFN